MKHAVPFRTVSLSFVLLAISLGTEAQHASDYNNAGVEAYKAGNYLEAISFLEGAIKQAPDSPVVRRNLCNAYQSQGNVLALSGDIKGALRYAESAAGIDPANVSPFIQSGSYYLQLNDVNVAIQRLETAIQLKPGDLDSHELLGQAYYMDNDLSSARVQWDYVLDMAPDRKGLLERYEKAFREEAVEMDFERWKSRHFRISYPPEVANSTRSVIVSILDRAYLDIGRQLGGVFPPPPIHVVLYSSEQFNEATQMAGHIGAVYDGKIRSPLTDANGIGLSEEELRRRLTHEYVHVAARHLAGANIPWWLNEGLAEFFSKKLSGDDVQRLRMLYAEGNAFSLAQLQDNKVIGLAPDLLRQAYLQSNATVDLLWNRFGRSKMLFFLKMLGEGAGYEDAFYAAYRRNHSTIERDVAAMYR